MHSIFTVQRQPPPQSAHCTRGTAAALARRVEFPRRYLVPGASLHRTEPITTYGTPSSFINIGLACLLPPFPPPPTQPAIASLHPPPGLVLHCRSGLPSPLPPHPVSRPPFDSTIATQPLPTAATLAHRQKVRSGNFRALLSVDECCRCLAPARLRRYTRPSARRADRASSFRFEALSMTGQVPPWSLESSPTFEPLAEPSARRLNQSAAAFAASRRYGYHRGRIPRHSDGGRRRFPLQGMRRGSITLLYNPHASDNRD